MCPKNVRAAPLFPSFVILKKNKNIVSIHLVCYQVISHRDHKLFPYLEQWASLYT